MKVKIIVGTVFGVLIGVSLYVYMDRRPIELAVEEKQIEKLGPSVEERFDKAKSLLIRHCATCLENSRKGMLQGIHAMENVIQDGFAAAEAKILLGNGYNQMIIIYTESPEEAKIWAEKKRNFLGKALKEHPLNDNLLVQLADSTVSTLERINLYRKAFEHNTKNTSAGASLAIDLLQVGEKQEAMEVAKKAISDSEQGATHTFGRLLFFKFRDAGLKEEAKDINVLIDKIFEERNKPT